MRSTSVVYFGWSISVTNRAVVNCPFLLFLLDDDDLRILLDGLHWRVDRDWVEHGLLVLVGLLLVGSGEHLGWVDLTASAEDLSGGLVELMVFHYLRFFFSMFE